MVHRNTQKDIMSDILVYEGRAALLIALCPSTATGVSPSVPPPGFDQHYISGLCCVFYQLCHALHLSLQEEVIILL